MNKDDLLLTNGEIPKSNGGFISFYKDIRWKTYKNVANFASLKTAKAIRDEFRTVYKHGDIKTFRLIFDNLDSIIKEIENV